MNLTSRCLLASCTLAYNQEQDSREFSSTGQTEQRRWRTLCSSLRNSPATASTLSLAQGPFRFEGFSHGLLSCKRFPARRQASPPRYSSKRSEELADIRCDNLGFNPIPTDYMYIMKCSGGENFSDGELQHFGNIELNPSACVLNYGQGIIEDLKAQKKQDKSIILFRP
ncbi:branched-chain-amino-acid aminotransferase 3 chloroplastic-like [Tripterygium wilfordii]|uniref:Branched-chain-amino-acid aminotransferase 3 chloroplastic-like n=1 Tax=Tripterygium wilfordii TaxID=458696 RepID=A0A7J7D0F3_TRIWF|nr:branched-chain-amino-acid aminotransferase 3 chloroplastic-like [Tripterygium wilfordii]